MAHIAGRSWMRAHCVAESWKSLVLLQCHNCFRKTSSKTSASIQRPRGARCTSRQPAGSGCDVVGRSASSAYQCATVANISGPGRCHSTMARAETLQVLRLHGRPSSAISTRCRSSGSAEAAAGPNVPRALGPTCASERHTPAHTHTTVAAPHASCPVAPHVPCALVYPLQPRPRAMRRVQPIGPYNS